MSAKKGWVSAAITLVICTCGWCKTEVLQAEKVGHQEKLVKVSERKHPCFRGHREPSHPASVSQKDQSRRAATISRRNTSPVRNLPFLSRIPRCGISNGASFDNQPKQTVDLSALTFNMSFSEAIDILRNSTDPPLKIVVLWRDLSENADVEQDTPIYIQGISRISLRTGLKILLRAVSSGLAELDYVVDNGIIIVGTKDSLPAKMVVRIYDISYLAARPAAFAFNLGPGFARGWAMRPYPGRIGQRDLIGRSRGRGAYGRRVRRGTRR